MHTDQLMLDRTVARLRSVLSEGQKVRLLTDFDSLADPAMNALGVPRVRLARVRAEALPGPASLARSWDPALTAEAAAWIAAETVAGGAECVILPGARMAVCGGTDGTALAEDPYLAGAMAGAFVRGARNIPAVMEDHGNAATEAAFAGEPYADILRNEFVRRPRQTALGAGEALGVLVDEEEHAALTDVLLIHRRVEGTETVRVLRGGGLCLVGSETALQEALHKYRRMRSAMEHGKVSAAELEAAEAAGEAMSEAALDAALGRLLTFALACAPAQGAAEETAPAGTTDPSKRTETTDKTDRTETAETTGTIETTETAATAEAEDVTRGCRADPTLVSRAMAGATVLLDNRRGILPLKCTVDRRPVRVVLVGALEDEGFEVVRERLDEAGCRVVGWAAGMEPDGDGRRDDYLEAAVSLVAAEADVVLLFPDTGKDSRTRAEIARGGLPRLSAAARALCDRVCAVGKPVILVLGERMVEPNFLERQTVMPAAVLMAPYRTVGGMAHLVETLLGHRAPAGRLTATVPTGEADIARRGMRQGPFVGYRYYDTVGFGTAYPFGHGLTYTRFRYSHLTVEPGRVRFTVRNVGRRAGVAIPQVYAGLTVSHGETTALDDLAALPQAVIRRFGRRAAEKKPVAPLPLCPRHELVAHACLELAPGESRTVELAWAPGTVLSGREAVYMATRLFTVSVGESVTDIRLSGTVRLPGGILPAGGDLTDYLPTISNIQQEHYTMEASYTPMKSSLRNLIFGLAALLMAVSLKIYNIVSVSDAVFLDILSFALAAGATVFFVMEWIERRRESARKRAEIEALTGQMFAGAEGIPLPSAEALFDRTVETADDSEEETAETAVVEAYDYFADVDRELTLSVAVRELCALATERGVALDHEVAQSILASFMTSRLIVVQDMTDEAFEALLGVLCEYFGCPVAMDRVDESYTDEAAVLYGHGVQSVAADTQTATDAVETALADTTDAPAVEAPEAADMVGASTVAAVVSGTVTERQALSVLDAAEQDQRHMHMVVLCDVRWTTLSRYFVSYARYARMPHGEVSVTVQADEEGSTTRRLPENLWFILRPTAGEALKDMPDYVAEVATVHRFTVGMTTVDASAERAEYHPFTYGQMLYLADRVRAEFALDEDIWKQFDRLGAYVGRYSRFRMGNKLWLGLESYIAALLDMGRDRAVALDEAMAVGLLPVIIPALDGRLTREDRGLGETLDALFGDGATPLCRRVIKQSGATLV